jgi:hypothetical protein
MEAIHFHAVLHITWSNVPVISRNPIPFDWKQNYQAIIVSCIKHSWDKPQPEICSSPSPTSQSIVCLDVLSWSIEFKGESQPKSQFCFKCRKTREWFYVIPNCLHGFEVIVKAHVAQPTRISIYDLLHMIIFILHRQKFTQSLQDKRAKRQTSSTSIFSMTLKLCCFRICKISGNDLIEQNDHHVDVSNNVQNSFSTHSRIETLPRYSCLWRLAGSARSTHDSGVISQ